MIIRKIQQRLSEFVSPPRTGATVVMRADAHLLAAASMLIMASPGRIGRARRDRDRTGSGNMRAPDTETEVVVPVVGGVPVAVGRAEVLWIVVPGTAAQNATTRGRSGPGAHGVRGPETVVIRTAADQKALYFLTPPALPRTYPQKKAVRLRRKPKFCDLHQQRCSGRKEIKVKDLTSSPNGSR